MFKYCFSHYRFLFGNVTIHIILTSNPHDTLSAMPGKMFVQMYSNLECGSDLAEEQSMGKRQVGEEEGKRQSGKIGKAFPLFHKFKSTVGLTSLLCYNTVKVYTQMIAYSDSYQTS